MKRSTTPLIVIDRWENPRFARSNTLLGKFTDKRCPDGKLGCAVYARRRTTAQRVEIAAFAILPIDVLIELVVRCGFGKATHCTFTAWTGFAATLMICGASSRT
jgi:hypothetical protein